MEGNPNMLDLSLFLLLEGEFISVATFVFLKIPSPLSMHEVKIKIFEAASVQLPLEIRLKVFFFFEAAPAAFVGERIRLAGITAGQAMLQSRFGFAGDINSRCVEIVEAFGHEMVDHYFELLFVDMVILHRQTHASEAESSFDCRKRFHKKPSYLFKDTRRRLIGNRFAYAN